MNDRSHLGNEGKKFYNQYHEGITPCRSGESSWFLFLGKRWYMRAAVVDGQGGGIGKLIIDRLRKSLSDKIEITALGTNALATSLMLRAGANEGASGENAICITVRKVDVILGPIAIVIANSMLGEVTPAMARAVAAADAEKILMPLNKSNITIVGIYNEPLPHLVDMMVKRVEEKLHSYKQDHEGPVR